MTNNNAPVDNHNALFNSKLKLSLKKIFIINRIAPTKYSVFLIFFINYFSIGFIGLIMLVLSAGAI